MMTVGSLIMLFSGLVFSAVAIFRKEVPIVSIALSFVILASSQLLFTYFGNEVFLAITLSLALSSVLMIFGALNGSIRHAETKPWVMLAVFISIVSALQSGTDAGKYGFSVGPLAFAVFLGCTLAAIKVLQNRPDRYKKMLGFILALEALFYLLGFIPYIPLPQYFLSGISGVLLLIGATSYALSCKKATI